MPKRYPPLSYSEIKKILKALGFVWDRTKGSHEQWKENDNTVTLDSAVDEPGNDLMMSIVKQSGRSREDFYCATKRTAKKINMRKKKK